MRILEEIRVDYPNMPFKLIKFIIILNLEVQLKKN